MLSLPSTVRIFVALDPVDMRGSFDALAGHVRRLHGSPTDGHLYFFVNRRKTLMKTLWLDRSGWCIFSKRLEAGTFELPLSADGSKRVAVDATQLAMILEGVELGARRRKRYRFPDPP
jgi:transposase